MNINITHDRWDSLSTCTWLQRVLYPGVDVNNRNCMNGIKSVRIIKAESASFAQSKFLGSKVLCMKTELWLYTAIIRPTLTYGCEVWTTTSVTVRRLSTFENKIWRTSSWHKDKLIEMEVQKELGLALVISYIKGQRMQWLGRIMRNGEKETIYVIMEWEPKGKRPSRREFQECTRMEGDCLRSREMKRCTDGGKGLNRVINTSEEEVCTTKLNSV